MNADVAGSSKSSESCSEDLEAGEQRKLLQIGRDLSETRSVLNDTLLQLAERGENLKKLLFSSHSLDEAADSLRERAVQLNRRNFFLRCQLLSALVICLFFVFLLASYLTQGWTLTTTSPA